LKSLTAFNKFWSLWVYRQLNFTKNWFVKTSVNQDIVCAFFESIFDSYYTQNMGEISTNSVQLFVNGDDFLLLWRIFASH